MLIILPGAVAFMGPGSFETMSPFGEGSGDIVLRELRCSGNESSLFDCDRRPRCEHSEDAAVICQSNGANYT